MRKIPVLDRKTRESIVPGWGDGFSEGVKHGEKRERQRITEEIERIIKHAEKVHAKDVKCLPFKWIIGELKKLNPKEADRDG